MVSNTISSFCVDTTFDDLPEDALHILKLSLLDWMVVGLAGQHEPVSTIVKETIGGEKGAEQASAIGLPFKVPMRAAALINGTTSHALDYDDTHFMHVGHTSVVVLSAALAVGEYHQVSGSDFLTAALIGSEVACHVGAWLGRAHYNHGFHQTATAGAYGAAMAAAKLMKLNKEQTLNALGIVSTRASGLKSQFGSMGKPYNAGIAAANGVEAALLASKGFEAALDGLEGEQGFAQTHNADANREDALFKRLSKDYALTEVQHKFHACCHGLHAALEAMISMRDEHQITAAEIDKIQIRTNPRWLRVCNIKKPKTGLEAKFSYTLTAAMIFAGYDTAALSTYSDTVCSDAELISLRDHVEVRGQEALDDMVSHVVVKLKSGQQFETVFDLAAPQTGAQREEKVRKKAIALLGEKTAAALWRPIEFLERENLTGLTRFLQQN